MEGEPSTPTASEPGCAADEGRTGDRPRSSYTKQADRRRYRQSRILPTTLEDKQDEVAKRISPRKKGASRRNDEGSITPADSSQVEPPKSPGKRLSVGAVLQKTQSPEAKDEPEEQFRLRCKNCSKTLPDVEALEAHIRYHQIASFNSGGRKTFLVRVTVKNPPERRKFVCDICKRVCLLKHHLQRHMRIHLPKRRERFKCEVCSKTYHDMWYMKRHQRTHAGVFQFGCQVCGKGFAHKFHLRHHMRTHPECADCHLFFKRDAELELHRASEHVC